MTKTRFLLGVIALGVVICCSNCITIEIHRGGVHSGFNELTLSEKKRIVFTEDITHINNASDSVVFSITPDKLKRYMNQFDRCLVYFWNATCSSPYWKSPIVVQDYCKKNNLHLILIVNHYDHVKKLFDINSSLKQPVFVMNASHYETDKCRKYVPKFRREFLGDIDKKHHINYWIYYHGMFEKCLDLEEN